MEIHLNKKKRNEDLRRKVKEPKGNKKSKRKCLNLGIWRVPKTSDQ